LRSSKHDNTAAGDIPEDNVEAEETVSDQDTAVDSGAVEEKIIKDLNDKYLRLYAEFDNYRKRIAREKEELIRYGNESLLYELLPVIDNLELALKHSSDEAGAGIVRGVEITLKELRRTLEKFGLSRIEAEGKEFDPSVHHAMTQVEREDMDEKMVAEEMRAGYLYRDKVLRPSLVAVSVKPKKMEEENDDSRVDKNDAEDPENQFNEEIEEEDSNG